MQKLYHYFLAAWYQHPILFVLLYPLSLIYRFIIFIRYKCYQKKIFKQYRAPVPVIVVGNLLVGGTGKTPMVIALAKLLQELGFKPGVITRGYGSDHLAQNLWVTQDTDPKIAGDEAVLIATQTQCPVVKNKNRVAAAQVLASQCDIIISDDGLQHYKLISDIKIAMLADKKWLRNYFCLPAGPWREPQHHLANVDFQVASQVSIDSIYPLHPGRGSESFVGKTVHAVCAIGAPWRFFSMLNEFGINTINHAYPDHYLLREKNLNFKDNMPVLITEKDAIKCKDFTLSNIWVVKIKTQLDDSLRSAILEKIHTIRGQQ